MPPKRAWCTRCSAWLGLWHATTTVAVVDGQAHAVVTGHPVEVWDVAGRLAERLYGSPALPLWEAPSWPEDGE